MVVDVVTEYSVIDFPFLRVFLDCMEIEKTKEKLAKCFFHLLLSILFLNLILCKIV